MKVMKIIDGDSITYYNNKIKVEEKYNTSYHHTIYNYLFSGNNSVLNKISSVFSNEFLLSLFNAYDVKLLGGSITSIINCRMPNDYDLYFGKYISREKLKCLISNYNDNNNTFDYITLLYESKSSITYKFKRHKLQFIFLDHLMNIPIKQLFEEVDFSICQCLYSFNEDCFYVSENFIYDCLNNSITYNPKSRYPISSMLRIFKYSNRNYVLPTKEYVKLAFSIANLNLKTYNDVILNLTAISSAYYKQFTEILDEIKDQKFDYEEFIDMFEAYLDSKKIIETMEQTNEFNNRIKQSI